MIEIRWRWIVIVLVVACAWKFWPSRALKVPPGSVTPSEPVQMKVDAKTIHQHGQYALEVLADFEIEARVLSKELYSSGRESELSPVDLALGWGAMSDSSVLEKLSISQGGRFYHYRWENEPPIPVSEIVRSSANMHLIPADSAVEKKMKSIRAGEVVYIVGQLVEARAPDGWRWRSSLTREDSGAGACEVVRVESIDVR
ncbi:MAG: hypothetical protein C4516_03415 [Oxalobacter sp.]|nr:MAG: hypothetical protein C4516_03415 [Oxalobacter sp.]